MRRFVRLGLLVGLLAGTARAQDSAGAEAVALAFQTAYETDDFETAADLLTLEASEALLAAPALITEADPFLGLEFDDRSSVAAVFGTLDRLFIAGEEPGVDVVEEAYLDGLAFEIVGHVAEAPEMLHVLVRSKTELFGRHVEGIATVTTIWDGEQWRVALPFELVAVLAIFEAYADDPEAMEAAFLPDGIEVDVVGDPKKR